MQAKGFSVEGHQLGYCCVCRGLLDGGRGEAKVRWAGMRLCSQKWCDLGIGDVGQAEVVRAEGLLQESGSMLWLGGLEMLEAGQTTSWLSQGLG